MKNTARVLAVFISMSLIFYVYADPNELQRAENSVDTLCEKLSLDTISDKQIKDTVNNLVFHDKNENKSVSLDHMSKLMKILKNRPIIASWLHQYTGRLNRSLNNEKIALEHFVASTNLLDSLYAEVTVQRQESLLELGSAYYRLGDKENADKAFFMAMKFPYYIFPTNDNEVLRRLEVTYRRSIMGLIMCRAENIQKLKEIRIIPAANDLRPKLEEAIKRAEGKLDEDKK